MPPRAMIIFGKTASGKTNMAALMLRKLGCPVPDDTYHKDHRAHVAQLPRSSYDKRQS